VEYFCIERFAGGLEDGRAFAKLFAQNNQEKVDAGAVEVEEGFEEIVWVFVVFPAVVPDNGEGCIEKIYSDLICPEEKAFKRKQHDFVFHMTDWLDDLDDISHLFKNHKEIPFEKASQIVFSFLDHATNHILAAAKLIDYTEVSFDTDYEK